jgi:signal transduction histidine kinase
MKSTIIKLSALFISDLLFAVLLFFIYTRFHSLQTGTTLLLAGIALLFALGRTYLFLSGGIVFYRRELDAIRGVISEFKKGRFIQPGREIKENNELDSILSDLIIVGRHLDSIVTSQKKEIDNFIELYNSIIFSISSYFIVLGDDERVLFANEGFYKKFQLQRDEIYNKKIEEIFYFVNARLRGGIAQVRQSGRTVVLEKTHLLTLSKVSVIADVKVSNIVVKDRSQIIIIIDDVTKKLRNDYQISLMSQISESIQKNDEIDRVLYTILTGVTSGTGLGFNRALLFLVENGYLVGKMAVGPDSFEEAIEIWTAASSSEDSIVDVAPPEQRAGVNLLEKVLNAKYPAVSDNNLFVQSLLKKENIHVYDAWNDNRVSQEVRELMDVKEFLLVPLVVVNRGIGLIAADNKFNNAPILKENSELLSIFASQAAMSIESYMNLDTLRIEMQKLSERQDAIIESEKLAAVGRIAAHMAHEIRNPLVTMGGYARRIIQSVKDKSRTGKTIEASADIILRECERLEKTLSNVMDFSRPSKFIKEFNNLNDIISDTVVLLQNIFQLMLNLFQNSIDATPPGGMITVKTESDGDVLIVTISDTGSGIGGEDPNILFEPFYSTKVSGVGLGLAIVKKIIKDHNGSIRFFNRNGGGAECVVRLPVPGKVIGPEKKD